MNFGEPNHTQHSIYRPWDEMYDDEDTFPEETDDYELSWARKSLKRCLRDHELNRGVI